MKVLTYNISLICHKTNINCLTLNGYYLLHLHITYAYEFFLSIILPVCSERKNHLIKTENPISAYVYRKKPYEKNVFPTFCYNTHRKLFFKYSLEKKKWKLNCNIPLEDVCFDKNKSKMCKRSLCWFFFFLYFENTV